MTALFEIGALLRRASRRGGSARSADAAPGIRPHAGCRTAGSHGFGVAAGLAALLCVLFAASASAHGYGHRYHGYERGHGSIRLSLGYSRHDRYHRRPHHYRSYRRAHGSSLYFSYSAPLYVAPRYYYQPAPVVIHERPVVQAAPRQLPDMPDLAYTPQQGQDQAQTTADRQACESIAWRASRPGPATATTRTVRTVQQVPGYVYPDNPIPSAAGGAALGALGGAIAGDAGAGAAIGAAVGAASWLLGAAATPPRNVVRDVVVTEYLPAAGPDPQELRSRLIGCMRERGYAVG